MTISSQKSLTQTPMMTQYFKIKSEYKDALLFYRMGDFYELFFEDAVIASAALNITLTKRGRHNGDDIAMCGVPYHSSENYLLNLIRKGHKVAVCEQLEKPEDAKKRGYKAVVNRGVVRLITPGTLTEENLLETQRNNYLFAFHQERNICSAAWADISTGDFYITTVKENEVGSLISRIRPSEILVSKENQNSIINIANENCITVTILEKVESDARSSNNYLNDKYFKDGTEDFEQTELIAIACLFQYFEVTQCGEIPILNPPVREKKSGQLKIDSASRRNLELTQTLSGKKKGSLLDTINLTMTNSGARLLETRLKSPSINKDEIENRLDIISFFIKKRKILDNLRSELKKIPDMERALSRIGLNRGSPRDLSVIRDGIKYSKIVSTYFKTDSLPKNLSDKLHNLYNFDDILLKMSNALIERPPVSLKDSDFIKSGFNIELDETRKIRNDSKQFIMKMQNNYISLTGVNSLKIKFNNMLGYFIETPASQSQKMLSSNFSDLFVHRQTTTNCIRFSSQQLSDLESKILNAQSKANEIEAEIFSDLVLSVVNSASAITDATKTLAEIDLNSSFAVLALTRNFTRPIINEDEIFDIEKGRHPVVEAVLNNNGQDQFISNHCNLSKDKKNILLITGPNMAGKSTFLRQNALIVILAQMGCFVPAEKARIGIVDQIFSRVGASDDLARGHSTFMIEMIETATILNQASSKSFIIMDEIGRGTATHDGLSIAWATLEHIHNEINCRTLFATHFHELTQLENTLPKVKNAKVAIREWNDQVIFLHEVVYGKADKSYGIQVAKLAGIPKKVTNKASIILETLEKNSFGNISTELSRENKPVQDKKISFALKTFEEIKNLDTDNLTPKQALQILDNINLNAQDFN